MRPQRRSLQVQAEEGDAHELGHACMAACVCHDMPGAHMHVLYRHGMACTACTLLRGVMRRTAPGSCSCSGRRRSSAATPASSAALSLRRGCPDHRTPGKVHRHIKKKADHLIVAPHAVAAQERRQVVQARERQAGRRHVTGGGSGNAIIGLSRLRATFARPPGRSTDRQAGPLEAVQEARERVRVAQRTRLQGVVGGLGAQANRGPYPQHVRLASWI